MSGWVMRHWILLSNGTVDAYGSVYNYGDAPNDGGMAGQHRNGSIIAATGR